MDDSSTTETEEEVGLLKRIEGVKKKMKEVESKLKEIERKLEATTDTSERNYLRKKQSWLCSDKSHFLFMETLFLEEINILLQIRASREREAKSKCFKLKYICDAHCHRYQ